MQTQAQGGEIIYLRSHKKQQAICASVGVSEARTQSDDGRGAPTGGCQSKTLSHRPAKPEVTISTSTLGRASLSGASSSVPSLYVDGNQRP